MIARRKFLIVAGAHAVGAISTLHVQAQPMGKVHRVGLLTYDSAPADDRGISAFRERLAQLGYVEGLNLHVEIRSAERQAGRLPALAAEFVGLDVDVIVTFTTPAAQAAKAATTTVPIVMAGSAFPVELGLVASLGRPGGNVTGVTNSPGPGFAAKQLQFLKEAAPKVTRIAIIGAIDRIEGRWFEEMQASGPALGVTPVPVIVNSPTQSDVAALLTQARTDALYVFPNVINHAHATTIFNFAATNRLPTMYGDRRAVDAGGLMSYWVNWLELRRHAASYVDKILRGSKPADLPVEGPTMFELVINLKTARTLGLTIPQSLLLLANEVLR
jgi:putative ABC transport system substrate-binding protein